MSFEWTCACGRKYRLADEMAGKKVKCKQCGQPNVIPAPGAGGGVRATAPRPRPAPAPAAPAQEEDNPLAAALLAEGESAGAASGRAASRHVALADEDPLMPAEPAFEPAAPRRRPMVAPAPVERGGGAAGNPGMPFGMASLFLFLIVAALFFVPWIDIFIISISPATLLSELVRGWFSSAHGVPGGPSMGNFFQSAQGFGAIAILIALFVYPIGLLLGAIGAIQTLTQWRSELSVAGFGGCLASCVLFFIGWQLLLSGAPAAHGPGGGPGVSGAAVVSSFIGLAPWFYFAAICSLGGVVASVMGNNRSW